MSAEVRQMKTSAEQQLAQIYASTKDRLPGRGRIADLRARAIRRFETLGLPHRRIEAWKYTDLRARLGTVKPLANPDDAGRAQLAGDILAGLACRRLVFVDGSFAPDLSDLKDLEPGLAIRSMALALAEEDALLAAHLGKVFPLDDATVELNTALMSDGAVIHIAAGATIARPLHLVFIGEQAAAAFVRSLIILEPGARATLIENHAGRADGTYQVNGVTELVVGDGAELDRVTIIAEGTDAVHVSTLMARVGAGARLNDFAFATGGGLVRNQSFLRFEGEASNVRLGGASLLRGRQHADTTLVTEHARGGCESRQMFKSVVDDEARAVFQGKIIVRPGAQKTDAKMMSQALLLSDEAEADHKPELEIFADDVQCGHGATTGALNGELKFYLMARGIPAIEAEAMLIAAFIGEAVEKIEHPALREALTDAVGKWLAQRG
jgi:Fe-S cluster assembly protein SufD